ncbi:hypothetical protein AB0M44_00710 [Streptosporangium subroseum]|uniref:hypothetical protein n=1 Tax=Streptosporangium subroseum TaxID=106412 RepID=UPI003435D024
MTRGRVADVTVIEWQSSQFSDAMEYGYIGGLRFFALEKTRDRLGKACWNLSVNLPGPKGLRVREQGIPSRSDAEHRAVQALAEFTQRWTKIAREVQEALSAAAKTA